MFFFSCLVCLTWLRSSFYPPEKPPQTTYLRKALEKTSRVLDYNQCDWIRKLLEEGSNLGEDLPEPGQQREGGTFWLKRPLKHTKYRLKDIPTFREDDLSFFDSQVDTEGFVEIMILRYNVYNKKWTQHTDKYTNTVKTLENTTLTSLSLFPKLYGKCSDLDDFHTIAVEFIPAEMNQLPMPTLLEECILRARAALALFEELHALGLILVDMKKGQWMARNKVNFVLQDVDDVVQKGSPGAYDNQIEWFQQLLKRDGVDNVEQVWETMFPGGALNEKYNVLGIDVLLNDLGFNWRSSHCSGITKAFKNCLQSLFKWTRRVPDLPTFSVVKDQIDICLEKKDVEGDHDFSSLFPV